MTLKQAFCQSGVANRGIVEWTGYIVPFAVLASVIGCISNGLYSTLSPTTSTAQWVVYQVLNGVGRGIGMPLVSKYTGPNFASLNSS